MMRKVLSLMANSGVTTHAELAAALGARAPEMEALLEKLAALGFVHDLACPPGRQSGGCAGCALGNACMVGRPAHVWTLTDRGRRAASKVHSAAT